MLAVGRLQVLLFDDALSCNVHQLFDDNPFPSCLNVVHLTG